MAQQTINVGSSPNAGDGDALRSAFTKVNANFTETYAATASLGATKQPLDGTLTSLAALTFAADKGLYATGADAFATYDLTAYGRSLGGAASAAAAKALLALAAADITDSTANGRAILTAASYAAMRTLLDLEPGVDFDPLSAKGIALGYAGLDGSGKVPTAQLPDAVLGALSYQGTWNATTNSPTIPAAVAGNKGHYRLVAVAGATSVDGITDWAVGDWIVSNGTAWSKIDNTDAVSSVAGLTGIISAAALRTALGLVIGTNVQAQNSNLAALSGLTTAANKLGYWTGSGTAALTDLTAFARSLLDDADAATARVTLDAAAIEPAGRCQLTYVSATSLQLNRARGRRLFINGVLETVPATGPTLSNGGLAADTTYYVYAFMSTGTLTLEASTTAPAVDATYGHRIKTGDATRTLVGMARTNASSQFADTASRRFVRSWFRDSPRTLAAPLAATVSGVTSATYIEIDPTLRCEFLIWEDEAYLCALNATCYNTTNGASIFTSIGFDGATPEDVNALFNQPGASIPIPCSLTYAKAGLSEGYHYTTMLGKVSAGTGAWFGSGSTANRCTNGGLIARRAT